MFGLLVRSWCVSGMAHHLCFRLLFLEQKELGVDFLLSTRLDFPGSESFLADGSPKLYAFG